MKPEDLLTELTAIPTAPFAEQNVLAYVRAWSRQRGYRVTADAAGNLLVAKPGRSKKPRVVLVAHADHPGFVAGDLIDGKTFKANFFGGVHSKYFVGSRVRFFTDAGEIVATVTEVDSDGVRPTGATLKAAKFVPPHSIGMWDVGGPKVKGQKFHCRVCDDLAGLAAGLAALDASDNPAAPNAVLVTRGEEEGFIGAIAAMTGGLLRQTDRLVSIETSAEQPYARQSDGMIIRVGDRTSIFNSAFTRFLGTRAEELQKADAAFKFQRALMPGGTCEATVFDAYDYTAAAVCVPLGNYHNMNTATGKIAAEYVDLRDWRSLVTLLTDVLNSHHEFSGTHAALRQMLESRYATFAGNL
ncbi:MAG: hypothetical protein QM754_13545 [Tepidisphaeraceae bacterium]